MRLRDTHILLLLLIGLTVFMACDQKREVEDFESDLGYGYIPLKPGKMVRYKLDSILFKIESGGLSRDTATYMLIEEISDTYTDDTGDTVHVILQTLNSWTTGQQVSQKSYSIKREATRVIRHEDNRSIIPLVFPARINNRWDGLSMFDPDSITLFVRNEPLRLYKDWGDFRISSVTDTYSYLSVTVDEVLTVIQADMENAIERRYSVEQYGKGLGLLYREMWILDTQNITNDPWDEKAERGFILTQQLIF